MVVTASRSVPGSFAKLLPQNADYSALRKGLERCRVTRLDCVAIEENLDRWRALPRMFGQRYLWVNVPAYRLDLIENGAVAFFDLNCGMKLALWPRQSLVAETGLAMDTPGSTGFALAHNVASKIEVDEVMAESEGAGAVIVKRAYDTPWGGYVGYFLDPDRHLWEVAYNPDWQ